MADNIKVRDFFVSDPGQSGHSGHGGHDHGHGAESAEPKKPVLFGVLAEYKTPAEVIAAAEKVRLAGYTKFDAHTPFPVHGIDDAVGIKPTRLPWVIFGMGLFGLFGGMLMQWWMNAYDYPVIISGKPRWSLAANIPVIFECTVLCAAYTSFFGVHLFNKLPEFYNPLFRLKNFKRATNDRFFLAIQSADPLFDRTEVEVLLRSTHASEVDWVYEYESGALPKWVKNSGIVFAALALIPITLAIHARYTKSEDTRIHIIKDMDSQPKFKAQRTPALREDGKYMIFADGHMDRIPPVHTVAFGENRDGRDHYYLGKVDGKFTPELPAEIKEIVKDHGKAFIDRGEDRFKIYCAVCHGTDGRGNGMVALRVQKLKNLGADITDWNAPANLTLDLYKAKPIGELYSIIQNGVNRKLKPEDPDKFTMPPYAAQIPVEDRWAIALYLRALQKSLNSNVNELPADVKGELK